MKAEIVIDGITFIKIEADTNHNKLIEILISELKQHNNTDKINTPLKSI